MGDLIDLQFFAEGDAGGDGAADAAQPVPERAGRRKAKPNPLADVRYGIQDAAVVSGETDEIGGRGAPEGGEAEEQPTGETFDDLIKGKYKNEYDKKVQAIVQDRLKASKAREAEWTNQQQIMAPMIQALAGKYGVDPTDIAGLAAKVAADDELIEEQAIERGMTPEQFRTVQRLEADNRAMRQAQEAQQREAATQQHVQMLIQQAEQAKQIYPGLDLRNELRNPEFLRLTSPQVGVDVRTAYEVVHRQELAGREMAIGAQKAAAKVAASVAANGRRPSEGNQGTGAPAVKTDPSTLTKADRAEIKRRVMAGEKIMF